MVEDPRKKAADHNLYIVKDHGNSIGGQYSKKHPKPKAARMKAKADESTDMDNGISTDGNDVCS